jgi:hypothetical protein
MLVFLVHQLPLALVLQHRHFLLKTEILLFLAVKLIIHVFKVTKLIDSSVKLFFYLEVLCSPRGIVGTASTLDF